MNAATVRARIALARFAIQALGFYIAQLEAAKAPTMSLREIAQAVIDTLDREK